MPEDPRKSHPHGARFVGAVSLGLAALATKWGLFNQLEAAKRGAPVIWMAAHALYAAPGFGMLGLLLLVFGDAKFLRRWIEIEGEDRVSPRVIWLIIAGMIPGMLLHSWLLTRLHELGYDEGHG